MEEIIEILSKYNTNDAKTFHDTTDMLCSKGIANGCYQDMAMLMDVISILCICEKFIKEGNNNE
jgi:hypothetical protein